MSFRRKNESDFELLSVPSQSGVDNYPWNLTPLSPTGQKNFAQICVQTVNISLSGLPWRSRRRCWRRGRGRRRGVCRQVVVFGDWTNFGGCIDFMDFRLNIGAFGMERSEPVNGQVIPFPNSFRPNLNCNSIQSIMQNILVLRIM